MIELYGQLTSVSAVLAGFAITFLALLLGHRERNKCLSASVAVTVVAAASLLVSALGWSLIASLLTQVPDPQAGTTAQEFDLSWLASAHRILSYAFLCGLVSLFAMLGLSGWLRNRALGIFSTAVSVGAALTVWQVLQHVID